MQETTNTSLNILSANRFDELKNKIEKLEPVIVVGDVGVDKYTCGEVNRISPEAPVPILQVSKEWMKLGLAANVTHNLCTLGVSPTLCGIIGEDTNGKVFENLMSEFNMSMKGVLKCSGHSTIFKERVITKSQQICRIDYESVSKIGEEEESKLVTNIDHFFESHSALILVDYCKGMITQKLMNHLTGKARECNKLIAVDPGRMTPPLYYKGVTLLKPNLLEAKFMVDALGYREESIEKMGEILIDKLDLTMLVITLGGEGMALFDVNQEGDAKFQLIPTVATEVFDVSGAGDTAISLITLGLLAGGSLSEAAYLGNCGSGVVVGKSGTATVNMDELKRKILC